jgi:hypothetical protein
MQYLFDYLTQVIMADEGGSGYGMSYYMSVDECPRKAMLAKITKGERTEAFQRDLGTAFHKLMELQDCGTLGNYTLPTGFMDPNNCIHRAWQLFTAYVEHYAGEALDVSGVEEIISTETHPALSGFVSVPFGIKPDRIVIPRDTRHLPEGVVVGKKYLMDFKTKSRRDTDIDVKYQNSPQFLMYVAAYNYLHPHDPLHGTIVDFVFNYKKIEPKMFHRTFVPPGDPKLVAAWVKFIEKKHEESQYDNCRLTSCEGKWGRRCEFENMCDKTSTGERYE